MSAIRLLAKKLTRFPRLKRTMKNVYAFTGNILSDKKTEMPGLVQISSNGRDHNFGYYDKSPWSKDQKYMIYLAPENAGKEYVSQKSTPIILYDRMSGEETILARTHVWNSQQGCMLQWLGPDFSSRILFNDFREGRYCSVVYNLENGTETVLQRPVYTVSADGKIAITLDFSRLNTFRPGYGYSNLKDSTSHEMYPDMPCMWKLDIENNTVEELPFTYKTLSEWKPQESMKSGYHKVNHIMLNPSATRFMFIHRWIVDGVTYHRLITCDINGNEMYLLLDDGMVSHNNWKNDKTIISYCYSVNDGAAYHVLHDMSQEREVIGKNILTIDGHPSYSPDGKYIITDTYPDWKRKQHLFLIRVSDGRIKKIGSIYSNIRYLNETRCDLHPRWNYDSKEICFDGAEGEYRQVYVLKVDENFFKRL